MRLLVIVPSRGRPGNAARLADVFRTTTTGHADLLFAVDNDDPQLRGYLALDGRADVRVGERLRMCGTLNAAAAENAWTYDALGFLGDDNLPRTHGWDQRITDALTALGTGVAYGNDLIHGPNLPTAVFLTADIVRALGWMVPPGIRHLFCDNAWKALGETLGALTYLPDVIIEHLHPIAGKADWDDSYTANNNTDTWAHDEAEFNRWVTHDLAGDVAKVRAFTG